MGLIPKTRLGTYEILGPLGAGGMGEVYRAKDLRLGREVAVKVLPEAVASSPNWLARLEREARMVAGLNHPNIVTLFSVEDHDGTHFLTMELVEGQTLSTLVTPGGLPVPRILDLSIPLTEALAAAHERGVVHRDLKPGNVMVTREGRVKVLDFGLAKMARVVARAQDETVTVTAESSTLTDGQVVGTVPYMSPEQIRGEAVDARSDLFALGIIMYELATGRRPFTGQTSVEVAYSILRDTPLPLNQVRADLPGNLERIISWCLEKNPRERIQAALDVNHELRRLRTSVEHGEPEKPTTDKVASIAVLPFVNRSASAEDEYFSDGLADELLNVLTKVKGLRVSGRSSSFHFKGKDVSLGDIGRALKVATVLDGSVRKAGNRVRISVQLVNVTDGYHLWSETYDRTLEDIFAVQDDIAQSVVKELRPALGGNEGDFGASERERAKVARGRATDPEAHRLYLLARYLIDRQSREERTKAIAYLKKAIELDPNFALAWAELARAYADEAVKGWAPVAEGFARARDAVLRALSLEPDLPEGHLRMGWIRLAHDWDWRGAEASFTRALELAPEHLGALSGVGLHALCMGRLEDAIRLYRRFAEQDPLSGAAHTGLGGVLRAAGGFPEAERAFRKVLELTPQHMRTRSELSLTILQQGRREEALAEAEREPADVFRLRALAIIHDASGRRAVSDAALQEMIEKHAEGHARDIADVYAVRGEMDAAFQWLECGYEQRDAGLTWAKSAPELRSLHVDPRWNVLMKKMGLEE